jgi:aspartate carbamoyltransferase catalytic subunit
MKELSVDHLLGIKYITEGDIQLIFETADRFKEVINRPIKKVPSLRDITIANLLQMWLISLQRAHLSKRGRP